MYCISMVLLYICPVQRRTVVVKITLPYDRGVVWTV